MEQTDDKLINIYEKFKSNISPTVTKNKTDISLTISDLLYNLLEGKNILFIDLETTGLPGKATPGVGCLFEDNLKFNSSRILEIGWYYLENYKKEFIFDHNDVKQIFRKPLDFKHIPINSILIHGITYSTVISEGKPLSRIMNSEFGNCLGNADFVIAYNAIFDVSIILNELHRIKFHSMYNKLKRMIDLNQILCMKKICKEYFGKIARQIDVYNKCFGEFPSDQHRAKGDCIAMVDIFKFIIQNKKAFDDHNTIYDEKNEIQ